MSLYPGASVRLIDKKFLSGSGQGLRMFTYNRVNLHIAAGNGSLFNFFNQPGRASSHFWVAKSGLVEQYVDTSLRAEADLQGNDATISIETEGSDQWSEAQIQGIIALVSWITVTHKIPQQLAQDSQLGATSKGISWHRLGIDGNFPPLPSRQAGRLQRGGGMHYSTSRGKVCPIDPNIDLIYDRILPGVTGGASGGGGAPTPPPVVTPPPVTPPPAAKPNCTALQRAVRTPADNSWGPNTDKNCDVVRESSGWGGEDFPYGVKTAQVVVGTKPDGSWGPKSVAAHDQTVRNMQAALHGMGFDAGNIDGMWGPVTEGAYQAARNACHI